MTVITPPYSSEGVPGEKGHDRRVAREPGMVPTSRRSLPRQSLGGCTMQDTLKYGCREPSLQFLPGKAISIRSEEPQQLLYLLYRAPITGSQQSLVGHQSVIRAQLFENRNDGEHAPQRHWLTSIIPYETLNSREALDCFA